MTRFGMGYDVHKLVEGRKLILGGVEVPHTLGLLGHSDADVLLHAISDALLGAAALGDIGRHFPDTDERYRGADSGELLDRVVALLKGSDYGVAVLPQPYVTAAKGQLGEAFRTVLSFSEEWDALDNGSRCITAGILVRREFAEAHPEAVEAFLQEFAASVEWVNANPAEAGELCESYEIIKAAVAAKAIPACHLVCITGAEMKEAAAGCLQVLFDCNPAAVGGAVPGDDYYYGA